MLKAASWWQVVENNLPLLLTNTIRTDSDGQSYIRDCGRLCHCCLPCTVGKYSGGFPRDHSPKPRSEIHLRKAHLQFTYAA